jgi:hypothetical protein
MIMDSTEGVPPTIEGGDANSELLRETLLRRYRELRISLCAITSLILYCAIPGLVVMTCGAYCFGTGNMTLCFGTQVGAAVMAASGAVFMLVIIIIAWLYLLPRIPAASAGPNVPFGLRFTKSAAVTPP